MSDTTMLNKVQMPGQQSSTSSRPLNKRSYICNLNDFDMAISTGDKAPEFSLFDSEKKKVSLEDYKGKNLVILFFPLAFTSVCTTELCEMRDNLSVYNNYQAEVIGISVDSLFTLAKFKDEQNLNFPLLSDFNKEASKSYGVLYETFPAFEMQGVSKRAAFVLDKEGIVRYEEICATPQDVPSFAAIQTVLSQLN